MIATLATNKKFLKKTLLRFPRHEIKNKIK
jgi:hypothetical protein